MPQPGDNIFLRDGMEWTPEHAAAEHAAGRVQLVDVRERHEWNAGHIPGSDHVVLEHLAWNAPKLDPEIPICFVCRLGVRAAMAAAAFGAAGYDAHTVGGGFAAWFDAGLSTEPHDARVSDH